MPAFCTHYLFFEDMKDWLKQNVDFELFEKTASIGAQGPDIFFFHRAIPIIFKGKSRRGVGNDFHKAQPERIFDAFKEYLKTDSSPIIKSYIYGFILHYALDKSCHPYVFAKEKEMTDSNHFIHHSSAHNRIEMSLDSLYLHNKLGVRYSTDFDTTKTIDASEEEKKKIGELISFVAKKVLNEELSKDEVVEAINDMLFLQKEMRDEKRLYSALCIALETPIGPFIKYFKVSSMIKPKGWKKGVKYANIEKANWTSPFDESVHNESFDELYEKAFDEAKKMVIAFNKNEKITDNISFLTGLEVTE